MKTTMEVPTDVLEHLHTCIDRGMEFLDEYLGSPEWVNEIDLKALDLNDANTCVCGQLFRADTGRRTIEDEDIGESDGYSYAIKWVIEHGVPRDNSFNSGKVLDVVSDHGFSLWNEEWIEERLSDHNDVTIHMVDPWELLTDLWTERIEKRRAELGTV